MAITISQRKQKFNEINRLISEFASEPEEKLVQFCLENRHSVTNIAAALGISSTALRKKYPHLMNREISR